MKSAEMLSHAERYSQAALRGLFNLRQLQYLDTIDTFRLRRPQRVLGALRTEAYDATVRVDSVAHALTACLAWQAVDLPEISLD